MRRSLWGVALLCLLGLAVSADNPNIWDRTYKRGGQGGSFPPCPEAQHDVTIKNGQFSIPWDVTVRDQPMAIGQIAGTVRPSGLASAKVTFVEPLPAAYLQMLKDDGQSIDEVRKEPVRVKFESFDDGRKVSVYLERWSCHTYWQEDRATLNAPVEGGTVNCNAAPYAVALWSAKRDYVAGDYTRAAVPGQPTRLYRCVDGCTAGQDPQQAYDGKTWAFIAACAGQKTADAALPANGSSKWDTKYGLGIFFKQDWRCPTDKPLKQLVVKNGRFSLPWYLSTDLADGQPYEDMQIGHVDGVIADDGKVTLRYAWTVDKLPPEVLEAVKYDKGHGTLEYVSTLVGAMTFTSDSGSMNPSGQGLKAQLTFNGDSNCEYSFLGTGYKSQQFKESDGWRVDCYSYEPWKSDSAYKEGDEAVVSGGLYRCDESPQCKRSARPGRSSQWKRVGRCK